MDDFSSQPPTEKETGPPPPPYAALVDPFLVEALQNPRHRLTILRMELDIQRFLQNSNQLQFEFQHFPSSYHRLAAHRVAQHYGLLTMVQDIVSDGLGNRIMARKTVESKYPAICLSEIPAKIPESDRPEHVKIAIRPRPNRDSMNGDTEHGDKKNQVKTVEERKEDYDRARARIFQSLGSPDSDDSVHQAPMGDRNNVFCGDVTAEGFKNSMTEPEKCASIRDGGSSRVAILRDREKDRTDPDYDRSYDRYVRNLSMNQTFNLAPFNAQNIQVPFGHYDTGFHQLGQIPRNQAHISHWPSSSSNVSSFSSAGLNQASWDSAYMQWPSPVMYTQPYEQFRHAVFQPPFCQQPLSFDFSQNH